MQMIVDFMLLAASAAAAVYCFILSGKLKKLNDLRSGLGASIASMSLTLEKTRRMLDDSKSAQREAEEVLRGLIEDASRTTVELSELVETILEAAERAADEIAASRDAAITEVESARLAASRGGSPPVGPDCEILAA